MLHLRKKERGNGKALRTAFAICQDIGFTVATRANQRTKAVHGTGDLPAILEEIRTAPGKPKVVKWLENATALERWDAQHHASLSTEIEQRLSRRNESDLRVSDVAELVDGRADPRRWGTKEFNYIEISDIDSQMRGYWSYRSTRTASSLIDLMAVPVHATGVKPTYTPTQGQYLAFIYYYTKIHGVPPAEADLQRYFQTSPPAIHQMIVTLEKHGFIGRVRGQARSIKLRLMRDHLPDLE